MIKQVTVLCLLLMSSTVLAEGIFRTGESFRDLLQKSRGRSQVISLAENDDVSLFCQINGLRDSEESSSPGLMDDRIARGVWLDSFIATEDFRTSNFIAYFFNKGRATNPAAGVSPDLSDGQIKNFLDAISKHLNENPGELNEQDRESILKLIHKKSAQSADQAEDIAVVQQLGAAYFCSDLTFKHLGACIKGIARIQEIAKPVNAVTLMPVWIEVIRDPIYMKVFKTVALKIADYISRKVVPNSRLFEELQNEFLLQTGDQQKATNLTWKTMGLLATGGGNTSQRTRLLGKPLAALDDLLHVLTNGAMVLDRRTATKGFLFTYPEEVNNICDYGKNYHFWMTAYLARVVASETKSAEGAAVAAYSAQKYYQFAKTGEGRDRTKPFKSELFSNYNNNIRLDVTLSAVGAWYGASSIGEQVAFSREQIDTGLRLTFKDAKEIRPKSRAELEQFLDTPIKLIGFYTDWKKIINPDAAFNFFAREVRQ